MTLLVIDDEPAIRAVVRTALASGADRVVEAGTGREGLRLAREERPTFIVLDLGLPDMDGTAVCVALRRWSTVPILVLSARHSDAEKAALLDAGADDYLTKPFSTLELQARVRAQRRRAGMPPVAGSDAPIVVGDATIDFARQLVERGGIRAHLTPTECALLRTFVTHAGRTLTHRQLFAAVWGRDHGDAQQYLRVFVAHLRRKVERDPLRPTLILTEPGVGYRFELPAPPP